MPVAKLEDLQPWRDITVTRTTGETETYRIWFTSNAIFKLERALNIGFEDFMQQFRSGGTGFSMLQALLYAGLEGARLKMYPRAVEWTMEAVGDLIDACGGHRQMWLDTDIPHTLGAAIAAGMPVPTRAAAASADTGDGKIAEEGPATTAADPSPAASPASTGADSSTARLTPGSKKKSSGT